MPRKETCNQYDSKTRIQIPSYDKQLLEAKRNLLSCNAKQYELESNSLVAIRKQMVKHELDKNRSHLTL